MANETAAATTAALKTALEARYRPPEWAFFAEVRNGTGRNGIGGADRRTADGFAMNCYPSRGLELHGFEIKATDSDLRSEIRDPSKADALGRYMDFWWLVTLPEVYQRQALDVPAAWGVLTMKPAGKLVITKKPAKIECEPMPRSLIASLLRRRVEDEEKALEKAKAAGWDGGYDAGHKIATECTQAQRELSSWKRAHGKLKTELEEFESASGVKITTWEAGRIGRAVRRLIDSDKALESATLQLEMIKRVVDQALRKDSDGES